MSKATDTIDAWAKLYEKDVAPRLGEGEKSLVMIAKELGVDRKTAMRLIEKWLADGSIISVGERRINKGLTVEAWKVVNT